VSEAVVGSRTEAELIVAMLPGDSGSCRRTREEPHMGRSPLRFQSRQLGDGGQHDYETAHLAWHHDEAFEHADPSNALGQLVRIAKR
jgi:hypothetical protein